MKLEKISTGALDPVENYIVEEVSVGDIAAPSTTFLKSVKKLRGVRFINAFTIEEFTEQVRKQFTSVKDL